MPFLEYSNSRGKRPIRNFSTQTHEQKVKNTCKSCSAPRLATSVKLETIRDIQFPYFNTNLRKCRRDRRQGPVSTYWTESGHDSSKNSRCQCQTSSKCNYDLHEKQNSGCTIEIITIDCIPIISYCFCRFLAKMEFKIISSYVGFVLLVQHFSKITCSSFHIAISSPHNPLSLFQLVVWTILLTIWSTVWEK